MTVKSFFADSVAAAMREARKELGDDAMLLKSRRATHDSAHLGRYEVVFGVASAAAAELTAEAATGAERAPGTVSTSAAQESGEALRSSEGPARTRRSPFSSLDDFQQKLIETDLDPRLALELVSAIRSRLREEADPDGQPLGEDRVAQVIAAEVERFFPRAPRPGSEADPGAAILFGPPGAGKTSTVVRLAVSQGLARGRRVAVFATPDFRVGGVERLRRYCALLDVEFQELAKLEELARRLDIRREDELILIDTPGFGPRDMDHSESLVAWLGPRRGLDRHLVLPATLKQADLRSAVNRFEQLRANWLLFTRVDETSKLGPIFSEAALSRMPISFVTTGQQVPGDIVPASRFGFLELMDKRNDRMLSAA